MEPYADSDLDVAFGEGMSEAFFQMKDAVTTAIAQIRRGDTLDAITTLEREFWPKWGSVQESKAAFLSVIAGDAVEAALAASTEAAPAAASPVAAVA